MKLAHILSTILFGSLFQLAAHAADFSTPENAVRSLEAAYINKNLEAAVEAKDFANEAKLMLNKIKPDFANNPNILKQTSEVLELAFRKEMKEKGFPDFSNLKCSINELQNISSSLVKLTETCVFPDGDNSVQDLYVSKSDKGWRVVNVPH